MSTRRPPARRAPARGRKAPAPRRRGRARTPAPGRVQRATAGDRVYVYVLIGVVVMLGAMAVGPLQSYTAAADRVDSLEQTRAELQEEVDRLEERRERLQDPEEIELMARTEFGLVKPGEVPFVVVTPEPELDRVFPDPTPADARPDGGPWYRRLGRLLQDLLR